MSSSEQRDQAAVPEELEGVGITPLADFDSVPSRPTTQQESGSDSDVQRLFVRAYSLVSAALFLSAFIASQVPAPDADELFSHQATFQFLFFFEIVIIALLARYVPRLPRNFSAVLLFVVAALNGASFSVFLVWIPGSALAFGFLMCGVGFAASAALATWRNIDLSSLRGMGLLLGTGVAVILMVCSVLRLGVDYWGTSLTGFTLFAILASYYCDDIRALDLEFEDDPSGWKSAICGSLILYLNFINLYLLATRFVGQLLSRSDGKRNRLF